MSAIFEKLRSNMFWFLDTFKTNNIKRNVTNIRFINENYSTEDSANMRDKYLNDILHHAKKETLFYRDKNLTNLNDFPVINKNNIRDHFDQFQAENYKSQKNIKVLTSGSTGTPFSIYQNKNKKN